MTPDLTSNIRQKSTISISLVILAISIAPIWIFRYIPFVDYQQWVYEGYLLRVARENPQTFNKYYEFAKAPIPNSAISATQYILGYFISSPAVIAKIFLSFAILSFILGSQYLIRTIQERPTAAEYLPVVWTYGMYFYVGFLNYYSSIGLCLFTVAYLHRITKRGYKSPANSQILYLALLLILVYFFHLFAWIPACIAVVVYATLVARQSGRRSEGFRFIPALIPSLLLLFWYSTYRSGSVSFEPYQTLRNKLWAFISPLLVFFRLDPFEIRPPVPVLLHGLVFGIIFLCIVILSERRMFPKVEKAPLLIAIVYLTVSLLIPFDVYANMVRPDSRFVLPAVLLLISSIKFQPFSRRSLALVLLPSVFVFAVNWYMFFAVQPKLNNVHDTMRQNIPVGARVYLVALRDLPLWNSCENTKISINLTLGTETVFWFDLARFREEGDVDTELFGTAWVIPREKNNHQLALTQIRRGNLPAAAQAIEEQSHHYDYIELYGCPKDVRIVEQNLLKVKGITVIAHDDHFALFKRD